MEFNIKALEFSEAYVGRHIKKSKKKFTWVFELDDVSHKIELYESKFSGKWKLIVDSEIQGEIKKKHAPTFQFSFVIGKHKLLLIEQGKTYELSINNVTFGHLHSLQERAQNAPKPEVQIEDVEVERERVEEEIKHFQTEKAEQLPPKKPVQTLDLLDIEETRPTAKSVFERPDISYTQSKGIQEDLFADHQEAQKKVFSNNPFNF